jgi:lipopolysaccharide export system protein LptA
MTAHKSLFTLISILMLWPLGLYAAENVQVDADSMEVIDTENKTIFRGNVVATRPSDQITSSEMVVTTAEVKQTDGTTKTITKFLTATGGVVITTKSQTIRGQWAKFYIQEDRLEVGGSVTVVQGKNTVRGAKLTINLKTNHMVVSGGRVRGNFVPK